MMGCVGKRFDEGKIEVMKVGEKGVRRGNVW